MNTLRPPLSSFLSKRLALSIDAEQPAFVKNLRSRSPFLPFLMLLLLAAQLIKAQDVSKYQLTASAGTFTPITGGTTVALLSQTDAISPVIALPFTFYYGGTAYTSLQATTRGYLTLKSANAAFIQNTFGNANAYIAPLWDELSGASGTASYVVMGTAPTRVFTFQWLNWRWNAAATAANISFQATLYEGSNLIQFIYRPEAGAFTSTSASATIGLDGGTSFAGDAGSYYNFVSLSDASASPSLVNNLYPAGHSMDAVNTRPAAGQTYTFTPTNDYCGHATPLAYGSAVLGSTLDASMIADPRATCTVGGTGTPSNAPGVFYSLVGNGQTMTVSTCSGPTATGGNTKLFVYSGSCSSLTCVGNNDDALAAGCGTNPLASKVTFATTTGTQYLIFVQYAPQSATGPFGLSVSGTNLANRATLGAGSIEVFPNPAARAFTVQLPSLIGEHTAQVTLLNHLGQSVQTKTVTLTSTGTQALIDAQVLSPGLYTVRVQAGGQVATRQVVVQ